ncbi:MAG: RES domain-containing protein [Thiomonas sp.]|uniref:RES family NAD+ phosphorylase n=1 Tax=Thiomonas sp. TaxID=2047785 RepID=UPI002A363CB9|nr:RES domain-containing protein [Thiomonas sp.]MDY0331653.1 RES domain-containing protein [Thiomonas sp.]
MRIFRIADARFPIWDATGASLFGGRWNSPGGAVIYGSLSESCAILERLVHVGGVGHLPGSQRLVIATVPQSVTVEQCDAATLPSGWDNDESPSARAFGDRWLAERRSAVLIVPSVIATSDFNALVNPNHPDARFIEVADPTEFKFDPRLAR